MDSSAKGKKIEPKKKVRGRQSSVNARQSIDDLINDDFEAIDGAQTDYMTTQPGILKNGTLMRHQIEALNWTIGLYNQNSNGILADQMGLGKTVEVRTFFTKNLIKNLLTK